MRPTPMQMKVYSDAYLTAIAMAADCDLSAYRRDDVLKIDWIVTALSVPGKPSLGIQLKCAYDYALTPDSLAYDLDVALYERFRLDHAALPRVVVLLIVPDHATEWVSFDDPNDTVLRHSAYWSALRGAPPTANSSTTSVHFPRNQRLTVDALLGIMETISRGGQP